MKPILIVLMGIPGAGKSSVRNLFDLSEWHLGSSDEKLPIDKEGNRQWTPINLSKAWKEVWYELGQALGERKNIILDNTFIHRSERAAVAGIARGLGYLSILIWLKTPLERCLENDRRRHFMVGANVIAQKYINLQKPSTNEGWNEIIKLIDSDNGLITMEGNVMTIPEYIEYFYDVKT